MRRPSAGSQYISLAISFGVVMVVSIFIMFKVGGWIDAKLGTPRIFTMVFTLMGIISGFRVLYSDIQSIDRRIEQQEKNEEDDTPWYA